MGSFPLISVIIPTYNRKACVMDAVNSVLSQHSSRIDFEVIVSDDGSTDGTAALFRKRIPRVTYYRNRQNRGVNAARNAAIRRAKGDYVLLLDSDDRLTPNAASILAQSFSKLGKVNFFGTADMRSGKRLYVLKREGRVSYAEWLGKSVLSGEFDPVIHRSVFRKALFDEERFCFEGFFWNRIIREHGLVVFDRVIRLYSFEQENRVSRKLLLPENAKKRYDDYRRYVAEFGPDYRSLKITVAFADVLNTFAVYAMLVQKPSVAKKAVKNALHMRLNAISLLLTIVFPLGPRVFRSLYSLVVRFV